MIELRSYRRIRRAATACAVAYALFIQLIIGGLLPRAAAGPLLPADGVICSASGAHKPSAQNEQNRKSKSDHFKDCCSLCSRLRDHALDLIASDPPIYDFSRPGEWAPAGAPASDSFVNQRF